MQEPSSESLEPTGHPLSELRALCIENLMACSEERVYFKDRDGRRIFVSAGSLAGLVRGGRPDEAIGLTDEELFGSEFAESASADDLRILETGETIVRRVRRVDLRDQGELWVQTTKLPLRDRAGRIIGTFGITKDLTAQVKAEEALEHLALHDPLTGLPNRALIMDRIAQLLARHHRQALYAAVMFVDVDDFKEVNDTLGHGTGDRLLVAVGHRLSRLVRSSDTVGRLGGDEFVVLVEGEPSRDAFVRVADRFLEAFREPFDLQGGERQTTVSASIGIAVVDDQDAGELLREADVALYEAKASGKCRAVVYAPAMQLASEDRHQLALELAAALDRGELSVDYQPVVALPTREAVGVEALLRWRHPTRGERVGAELDDLVASSGMTGPVGAWLLETACRQAAVWAAAGDLRTMTVKVTAGQLAEDRLYDDVVAALAVSRLEPGRLVLGLAAPVLSGDRDVPSELLSKVRDLGVRLAVDLFGAGCSVLPALHRRCVDIVKVDQSFVAEVTSSAGSTAVASALIGLSRALGLQVVTEDVGEAPTSDRAR